jgi:hypothetical protein
LFFLRAEGLRAGAGGFSTDVDEVCALVEHRERVLDGAFGMKEGAAVGEGVRRDVEDAHDEGGFAERKGAGAELPGEWWGADESHTGTMLQSEASERRALSGRTVLDTTVSENAVSEVRLGVWACGRASDGSGWCGYKAQGGETGS